MIDSVKVIPGCISCRTCEDTCPSVFQVQPTSKVITDDFAGKETQILQAEVLCPVQVIKVDKTDSVTLRFQSATLQSKKMLTDDIVELIFSPQIKTYQVGQYIALMMQDWKGKFARNYSLAEVGENYFVLNIKLLEKGRGSRYIKKLNIGKKIEFLGPLGSFVLQNTPKEKYFIATGTGLAPFIAMAQNTDPSMKKTFIIGARYIKDLYYLEKIKTFKNTDIQIYISREDSEYHKGRVTDAVRNIPSEAEVYICGNPEMLNSVKEKLQEQKHSNENIFHEAFTVSGKYTPVWKEIIKNGNIPFQKKIEWFFILLGLLVFPALFTYFQTSGRSLYDDFLVFGPFQNFWWKVAWWAVVFVMLIRPVSDIFSSAKLLRKLKVFRKSLGILTASIVVTTLIGSMIFSEGYISNYFLANRWNSIGVFPARATEVSALVLLLTSNTFSQKKLGTWWKRIQRLSYVYFICGGLVQAQFGGRILVYTIFGIWGVLWMIAVVKNMYVKVREKKK